MSISSFLHSRVAENEDKFDLLFLGDEVGLRRDFEGDHAAIDRHHDHTMVVTSRTGTETVTRCAVCPKEPTRPCIALKVIALPYAKHVDYDPTWHVEPLVRSEPAHVMTPANDAAAAVVAEAVAIAMEAEAETAAEAVLLIAAAEVANAVSAAAAEVAQTVSAVEADMEAEVAATARALEGTVSVTADRIATETAASASGVALAATQAAAAVALIRGSGRPR